MANLAASLVPSAMAEALGLVVDCGPTGKGDWGEPGQSRVIPDCQTDPHSAKTGADGKNLWTLSLRVWGFTQYRNLPILHRKEAFLAAEHPLRAKFARLTRLEEAKGLYADTSRIGTRDGWDAVLAAEGLRLAGHRLVRRS